MNFYFIKILLDSAVTLEMEVRPRYVIPDTNCFIEHLDIIKVLVTNTPYTVMVPLVGKFLFLLLNSNVIASLEDICHN